MGLFGSGGRSRGGCNDIGGLVRHGGSGGRGDKPDISAISYTDQEQALLSYDEKGKLLDLRDKA